MSTPFLLLLPGDLLAEMVRQAQAEFPNECCGLLAGRPPAEEAGRPVARVLRRFPLVNGAPSPWEFISEPRSMFEATRAMRREGLDILAVYHSHPNAQPKPSRTDLERNYSPDVVNFIISLQSTPPEVRAWWLTEKDYREAEWECVD